MSRPFVSDASVSAFVGVSERINEQRRAVRMHLGQRGGRHPPDADGHDVNLTTGREQTLGAVHDTPAPLRYERREPQSVSTRAH